MQLPPGASAVPGGIGELAAKAVQVSILLGYPIVGMLASILGADSSLPSIFYRTLVVIASGAVFLTALSRPLPGRISPLLYLFLIIYAVRLLYDWLVAEIDSADASLLYFAGVVLIPVAAVNLFAHRITRDILFARALVAFGLIFLLSALFATYAGFGYNPWASQGIEVERFQVYRVNPISIGMASGSVLLAAVYLLIETKVTLRYRFILLFTTVLGSYMLLASNSRGPLLSVSVAILWLVARRIRRMIYVIPIALFMAGMIYANDELAYKIVGRFTADYNSDGAIRERLISQQAAIESFVNYPILGQHFLDPELGVGSYPHNIIIETGMALGLVGLVLLLLIIIRTVIYVGRSFGRQHVFYTMLLLQTGILSLTSGTLWGTDALLFLVGTVLVVTPRIETALGSRFATGDRPLFAAPAPTYKHPEAQSRTEAS